MEVPKILEYASPNKDTYFLHDIIVMSAAVIINGVFYAAFYTGVISFPRILPPVVIPYLPYILPWMISLTAIYLMRNRRITLVVGFVIFAEAAAASIALGMYISLRLTGSVEPSFVLSGFMFDTQLNLIGLLICEILAIIHLKIRPQPTNCG